MKSWLVLTVLLSVLVICVQLKGGGGGRGGGGFRSLSSRSEGRGNSVSYSGYKGKKRGGTLKKTAANGATEFVGYKITRLKAT